MTYKQKIGKYIENLRILLHWRYSDSKFCGIFFTMNFAIPVFRASILYWNLIYFYKIFEILIDSVVFRGHRPCRGKIHFICKVCHILSILQFPLHCRFWKGLHSGMTIFPTESVYHWNPCISPVRETTWLPRPFSWCQWCSFPTSFNKYTLQNVVLTH